MTDKLQLAVNAAVRELAIRRDLVGLHMGVDHKRHSAWHEYGFKEFLDFFDLYKLYRRGGIAYGAVTKLVGNVWKTDPQVIQGTEKDEADTQTPWEKQAALIFNHRFWRAFAIADARRLVGRWSGILLHVKDNKQWNAPVNGSRALDYISPVWASAIKVKARDRQGNVTMWQYCETTEDDQRVYRDVHPDRLFILGDRSPDAIGFLEPAYNAFVSLEKVEGGSGEAFLKNAARQLAINFDSDIDFTGLANMYGVTVDELQGRFNETARELNLGNDAVIVTQGATTTPIAAAMADPTATYNVNLQTVSAATDIPTKILVGMQSGERASTEDQAYFDSRCMSERAARALDIEDLVDKLINLKLLAPIAEKSVMWDDLTDPSNADKLLNAQIMANMNASTMGGEPFFDQNEIRVAAGYEPRDDLVAPPLPETDPNGSSNPNDPSNTQADTTNKPDSQTSKATTKQN